MPSRVPAVTCSSPRLACCKAPKSFPYSDRLNTLCTRLPHDPPCPEREIDRALTDKPAHIISAARVWGLSRA